MKRLMLLLVVLVLVACGPDPYDQVDYKEKMIECLNEYKDGYNRVIYEREYYYSSRAKRYNQTDSIMYFPLSFSVWNEETLEMEYYFNDEEFFLRNTITTNIFGQNVLKQTILNDEQIESIYKELCE